MELFTILSQTEQVGSRRVLCVKKPFEEVDIQAGLCVVPVATALSLMYSS